MEATAGLHSRVELFSIARATENVTRAAPPSFRFVPGPSTPPGVESVHQGEAASSRPPARLCVAQVYPIGWPPEGLI
jgi:hypothetical protein